MYKKLLLFINAVFAFTITEAQADSIPAPPGVVINHIPKFTGKYIGSPSICILPNGDYVASHDEFGPQSSEFRSAITHTFSSSDKGETWEKISTIDGQFWSSLFFHNGALYIIGTNKHHGNVVIRRSDDGGKTWTIPYHPKNGLLLEGEYHTAPVPVLINNGYIWRALEYATAPTTQWGKRYSAMVISTPVDTDLLNADNWQKTNFLPYDSAYLDGKFGGWLEGNVVVSPEGNILNILRVAVPAGQEEYAAIANVSQDRKTISFYPETNFKKFPGGSKKFVIRYDAESERYWMLTNYVSSELKNKNPASVRNRQALCSSKDLKKWDIHQIVLEHSEDVYHGFQYVDWQFESNDIIFVSRTAYDDETGGARNNHDANYMTFHRIENFRQLSTQSVTK